MKYRLRAAVKDAAGKIRKPYVHEHYFDAANDTAAIDAAKNYEVPETDATDLSWLTRLGDAPPTIIWAISMSGSDRTLTPTAAEQAEIQAAG